MKTTLLTALFCSCAFFQISAESASHYADFMKCQTETVQSTLTNVPNTIRPTADDESLVPGVTAPITEQPAGREQTVLWNGKGMVNTKWGPSEQKIENGISTVVYGDDGSIYIKDPIIALSQGTWMKLDKVDETTYVAHKQPVAWLYMTSGGQELVYIQNMKYKYLGGEMVGTFEPADNTDLIYKVENGVISLQTTEYTTVEADGVTEQIPNIAGLSDENGEWMFYGDWEDSWAEFDEMPVTVPDDVILKDYVVMGGQTHAPFEEDTEPFMLSAGFKGDKVYFTNLPTSSERRQLAMEGTLKDGKVTIPCGQLNAVDTYLGSLFYTYRLGIKETYYPDWNEYVYDYVLIEGEDIVLNYNADKDVFTYNDRFAIVKGNGEYFSVIVPFINCSISPYVVSQQRPKNPVIDNFYPAEDGYFGELSFTIPNEDIEGNYIDPANISWRLFTEVDGIVEPWTFYADEYSLDEDMQDIPLGFSSDGIYAYGSEQRIDIFVVGINNWGVQSIYTVGDKVLESDVVWLVELENGIEDVISEHSIETQIIDLHGRQVTNPSQGIYVLISRQADGSVKTNKIIVK